MKFLRDHPWHPHIFRDRKKVQTRPPQHAKGISDLIKKPFSCDRNSEAECATNQVQNLMVPCPPWMDAQLEIAAELFDFRRSERLQFI